MKPEILYILPHKVYRLTVIDNRSGINIFSHNFRQFEIHEDLLASLLHGLQQMAFEVMNQGEMKQITFDKGYLIFEKRASITIGLIVSKPSRFIRKSLEKFTDEFTGLFQGELEKKVFEISQFDAASELIKKHFALIPQYEAGKNK